MKKRHKKSSNLLEWGSAIAAAVTIAIFVSSFVVVNAKVPTESMKRTIQPGDRFLGNRLAYINGEPERFDIIVFRYPDDESLMYIKRIIGLPGETVEIRDGKVYINDSETPLADDFIAEEMNGSFGPYQVPKDSYFVLGDNRNHSNDSRFWTNSFVKREEIIGKAMVTYWPLENVGILK